MYMGSDEWLTADSLPPIQIEQYIVQPKNMAGKGIGNGDGRYVNYSSKIESFQNDIKTVILQPDIEVFYSGYGKEEYGYSYKK